MKKNSSIPKAGFRLFRPDPRMFGKLFALFIFMTFCTYSYGVSQNKKMDVHFNNASIDFVIEYLESATDYTFVYNDTDKEVLNHIIFYFNQIKRLKINFLFLVIYRNNSLFQYPRT